jgi:hypothetical protein
MIPFCTIPAIVVLFTAAAPPAEVRPPVHTDEAAVIRQIIAVEGYAPQVAEMPGWLFSGMKKVLAELGREVDSLKGWQIDVKNDPRPHRGGFFACVYNPDGHILALSGNGPWLRNESLRALRAMPELRSIRWDHNGFVANHPEVDLYDGSGFDALADSKLADIKIGLGFNDKGMEQVARIKALRRFEVGHSRASAAGIAFFAGHPGLTSFSIAEMGSDRVTEQALATIARIPHLSHIGFHECFVTYDRGFVHLAPLKGRLEEIDLSMSIFVPGDLDRLRADHPGARIITLAPAEIVKRHRWIAQRLAERASLEAAAPLKAALAGAERNARPTDKR